MNISDVMNIQHSTLNIQPRMVCRHALSVPWMLAVQK